MRRLVIGIAAVAITCSTAISRADVIEITHHAPLPCAVLCANWEIPETVGFDVCNEPFPPGSYDQTSFSFTGEHRPRMADLVMHSIDYDMFVCTDSKPSVRLEGACICLPEDCLQVWNVWTALGCRESMTVAEAWVLHASGGKTSDFVVRTFNWSDPGRAQITVRGHVAVKDDTFCAYPVSSLCP